ncbi:MAG: hypothetical protein ACOCQ1_04405 [Halanaerobiaceae bacterium]
MMIQKIINKISSKKDDIIGIFVLGLILLIIVAGIPVFIKYFWGWIIPDLFPGAVEQGLITDTISWGTTFKLMILFLLFNIFNVD